MPTFENKRVLSLKGTTAEWAADDITPGDGEICIEALGSGVMKMKVGDGLLAFSALQYTTGWTLDELNAIVDARIATLGVNVSTGVPDASKLVRLDAGGLLSPTMIPDLATVRFLGFLDARDNDVDSALGIGFVFKPGDYFINIRDGNYDASWPTIGGGECKDNDLCWYRSVGFGFDLITESLQSPRAPI